MKVKCSKCGKVTNRPNLKKRLKQLGIELQDYLRIYQCKKCCPHAYFQYATLWTEVSEMLDPEKDIDLIEKYKHKLNWYVISHKKLSEEFISKYADFVKWEYISRYQKLSEEFIEKFGDRIVWYEIANTQTLSEPFIEKFADKLNWHCVSAHQKLSPEFIVKHIDKITEYVFCNPIYKDLPDPVKLLLKIKFGG